jgi:hypothetical protein
MAIQIVMDRTSDSLGDSITSSTGIRFSVHTGDRQQRCPKWVQTEKHSA